MKLSPEQIREMQRENDELVRTQRLKREARERLLNLTEPQRAQRRPSPPARDWDCA